MTEIPVYVTRKSAHGHTGAVSVSPALYGVLLVLGLLNAVGWLAYGLVAVALKFVGLF